MKKTLALLFLMALASGGCESKGSIDLPPIGARVRTSAALQSFDSCGALVAKLRANYAEEVKSNLIAQADSYQHWDPRAAPGIEADAAGNAASDKAASGREEGVNYSGTNNQEAGVDEADFVKTNGYYIYALSGHTLQILGVPAIGQLEKNGSLEIEGWPSEMLLSGSRIAVFSTIYTWDLKADDPLAPWVGRTEALGDVLWYRNPALAKATVIDVSDPSAPQVMREVYLEGYYQTGRRVDATVRMIVHSSIDVPGVKTWLQLPGTYWDSSTSDSVRLKLLEDTLQSTIAQNEALLAEASVEDFVPFMLTREHGGDLVPYPFTAEGCTNFTMADDSMSRGVTSILSLGLMKDELSVEADHIVSNWSTIYASPDTLLVAEPAQDFWWFWGNADYDEATNIHRFDIGTAGKTTYTGSGRLDGLINDQFSLSEQDGFVRVAATTGEWGRWWLASPPPPDNHVFVLAGDTELDIVGHLGGIATGERIWSSRFVGNHAFLVTMRYIDPLWTIDLSEPTNPRIIGELQVPGVSTYIHPLAADHLLTIGYGSDEQDRVDWSTQISLFDVSDFASPARDAALSLAPPPPGDGWSNAWSEATWEHKAFQYWPPLGLLAIPLSTYRGRNLSPCASEYSCYVWEYKSGLELVKVDTGSGTLAIYGAIDHSEFYNSDPYTWWGLTDIRRSIFMHDDTLGDFVYALSDRGMTVHAIADGLPLVGKVQLPGTPDFPRGWDTVVVE